MGAGLLSRGVSVRPLMPAARLLAAGILVMGAALVALAEETPTAFSRDLARLDASIARLASARPDESLLSLLYARAMLTGAPDDFRRVETGVAAALRDPSPPVSLICLHAQLCLQQHRLPEARRDIEHLAIADLSPDIQNLQADLALQEGRYDEARRSCEALLKSGPRWDALARLASLHALVGETARAGSLYAQAGDELTAKQMRAYAWIEVQSGLLALNHGRLAEAEGHYRRADQAYSGHWFVEEHLAEILGAQRRFPEAIALYEKILARTPRPEIQQALGDLYVYMGRPDQAQLWHDQALSGYLASAARGEVQYFHHLAGFYADVRQDGPEAVKWARRDLELRSNFAAHDSLAWALFRSGKFAEARSAIETALASGVRDAHVFYHAAMIGFASGQADEGRRFLEQVAALNPRYADSFHVHR